MLDKINWDKVNGLLPAIIQDEKKGTVLMLGYMNRKALEKTIQEGIVTFYSRTRDCLWTKGESSGNFLHMTHYALDCDGDALLITVRPAGPVCHLNTPSCFENGYSSFLEMLSDVIDRRVEHGSDESYVKKLSKKGSARIAQKVGEEAVEVVIASMEGNRGFIIEETADLLFHALVNLRYHQIELTEILQTLKSRAKS